MEAVEVVAAFGASECQNRRRNWEGPDWLTVPEVSEGQSHQHAGVARMAGLSEGLDLGKLALVAKAAKPGSRMRSSASR